MAMQEKLNHRNFAILALAATVHCAAAQAGSLSRADVKKIVQEYIQEHPQEIVESLQRMQQEQARKQQQQAAENVKKYRNELMSKPGDLVAGNPAGDVTLVEFFDYNCGYCKKAAPDVAKVIKEDPNLRVVFKEYPILSADSQTAARAAVALYKTDPSQYLTFHMEVMKQSGTKNLDTLLGIASKLGVESAKVKTAIDNGTADRVIGENLTLAQNIGLQGTPAFIIGDELIPGAVDAATLQSKIAALRKKKKP